MSGADRSHWDAETLRARIASDGERRRWAGGSPDATEIAAYARGLPVAQWDELAVVLGMTPELRRLAAARYARVVAVDVNPAAIALYADWLDVADRARERIVEGDWFSLARHAGARATAVLGDGVFGNLPNVESHTALLHAIRATLRVGGRFVTRMAMIPRGFEPERHRALALRDRFRAGRIDEAELGFGTRLVGHYESCYDRARYQLDNAKLFAAVDDAWRAGAYTDHERACIRRYYYGGTNCILSQDAWEGCLTQAGFSFRTHPCTGKEWYAYYVVYECW